jgi:para-aminobenzoate synthetase component 1
MNRQTAIFPLGDTPLAQWKQGLLHWAAAHGHAIFLDSNGHQAMPQGPPGQWECLAAADALHSVEANAGDAFARLQAFQERIGHDWHFGFLGYDLKNELERLDSRGLDGIGLPDLGFFQPRVVAGIRAGMLELSCLDADPRQVLAAIVSPPRETPPQGSHQPVALQPRMSQAQYQATVERIRGQIAEGDLYEMNLCQEFFAENAQISPLRVFEHLNQIGKAPCSAFLRWGDRYLLSASPERFLRKTGRDLHSQPIKGTRRRGSSPDEDAAIRAELAANPKDRAENVMIVDLVRNDLARHCLPGSVQVTELFGIHSFETVHQMISSVRGTLRPDAGALDALRAAFPPGSMTGAPKVMAMQCIEAYEGTRRGLYSGAVGYFDPVGDFDFNVVIRSILYNDSKKYVSAQVGGAIVFDSDPVAEYEECRVKLAAMEKALRISAAGC